MNTIGEIANILKSLKSAVVFTHTRPDGDTVGSALALSRALELLHIRTQIVNDCVLPEKFLFLEGAEEIRRFPTLDAEGYVCVDASDENRLGDLQRTFLKGAKRGKITVNIDHHISNTRYCTYNFVRNRASNCENIAEIIAAMGVSYDRRIAGALLAGYVTDSGSFSHSDVTGDTFRAAALAVDAGADVCEITYHLYKEQSKARAMMYAQVISHLRFFLDDRLCVALIRKETLDEYGLKQDATSGIVDFGLNIDKTEVSVCLLEVKTGQYKVSFRSKGKVDVNAVAGTFGGGGHVLASGCMLFGEFEEALDRLRYAVSQHMEDA